MSLGNYSVFMSEWAPIDLAWPRRVPKVTGWEIDRQQRNDGETNELANIQISLPLLSLSLSLHCLSKICVTKWTYNWKLGGPEIPWTPRPRSTPPRLDISSAELQGWYEPSGERWRKEKVIRREDVAQTCAGISHSPLFWNIYIFSPSVVSLPHFSALVLFTAEHAVTRHVSSFSSSLFFLITACPLTLVILVGHLWWCPAVLGHFSHSLCLCAHVC